jgi:hypothetical protein
MCFWTDVEVAIWEKQKFLCLYFLSSSKEFRLFIYIFFCQRAPQIKVQWFKLGDRGYHSHRVTTHSPKNSSNPFMESFVCLHYLTIFLRQSFNWRRVTESVSHKLRNVLFREKEASSVILYSLTSLQTPTFATPLPHYIIWIIQVRLNRTMEWGSVVDGKGAGELKGLQGGRT